VFVLGQALASPEHEGGTTVEQKNKFMDWYEAERQKRGWPELVSYGNDEPSYPNPALRKRYESLRDVRMRLGTAMTGIAAYGLGDLHDIWIVVGGQITPEMCAEARRLGAEVWTYSFRISREKNRPLRQRYYAGLYMWAYGLKGHTTWHHYDGALYKLVWMREGDKRPMPLVGWETRREGIDDYRYLQMLEDCVAARSDDPLAAEAKQWMDGLRARITVNPHKVAAGKPLALEEYDEIREKAADYIEGLGPVPADRIPPVTHAYLKDEAKPFRGKPVQECIAGLGSEEVAVRRGAAWALFEMGPSGAPAVPALANLLDDVEVRMPALRALEAIGSESGPALTKLTELLGHPDGFVRLGAVYAMGATGAPPVSALAQAVQDNYYPAAQAAGRALLALGPAALPALPVLIRLLDGPAWETQAPALKAIAGIGPEAASAVPHIIRNWQGRFPSYGSWIEPLAAIGPGASESIPMLEKFRKEHGSHAVRSVDAEVLYALCRIRRSPEDFRALVDLIGGVGGGPKDAKAALGRLEKLGSEAAGAAPQVRELIDKGGLSDDVKKRLEAFLSEVGPG